MQNIDTTKVRQRRFTLTAPFSAPSDGGDDDRTVDFIASTGEINANGYRIDQSGWVLDRFLANPVVLFSHAAAAGMGITDYDPEVTLPIGRAENVRVEDDALRCTIRFASGAANPMAERCLQLIREGMLNAVSVGFEILDAVVDVVDEVEIPRVTRAELYEISIAVIPADAGAVRAQAKADLMRLALSFGSKPAIATATKTRTVVVTEGFSACGVTVPPQTIEVPVAAAAPTPTEWERLTIAQKHELATSSTSRFEAVLEAHRRARPGCTF